MSRVNNEQMKALVAAFMERVGGSRARFRELLAVLKGEAPAVEELRAWRWLIEAARAAA